MSIHPVLEINVGLKFSTDIIPVGRLARRGKDIYFEYGDDFLKSSLEISPYFLLAMPGLKSFNVPQSFEGLPGVFADSLPDGWGRLLLDRKLRAQGIQPGAYGALERLAHVGHNGMGALVYEPDHSPSNDTGTFLDLDKFATHTQEIMSGEASGVLQELIALNGSSAGARPKAMILLNTEKTTINHGTNQHRPGFEHWMVKFANSQDGDDAGAVEFVYALLAAQAGIDMPETHLFPAKHGAGYFAIKRFDRENGRRVHMHSACGLFHSDFRAPTLEYEDLLGHTMALTKDIREVEKMYRIAVFNVLGHNRDDHSKNFSFLMNAAGEWRTSPAYDLTFSSGPNGHQSTTIMGEGLRPSMDHLRRLGIAAKIPLATITSILEQTHDALSHWPRLAKTYSVHKDNIALISKAHTDIR